MVRTSRIAGVLTILFSLTVFAASAQAQITCVEAQNRFSEIGDTRAYSVASSLSKSWADVQKAFGVPTRTEEGKPLVGSTTLTYQFSGCELQFVVGSSGKVTTKSFALRAAALGVPAAPIAPASPSVSPASLNPATVKELSATIVSMERTLAQLQEQIQALQKTLTVMKTALPTGTAAAEPQAVPRSLSSRIVLPTLPASTAIPTARPSTTPSNPTPASQSSNLQAAKPTCSESGSCYGDISDATGKAKTVYVPGYTRKDGTYVRGYYRSK